MYRLGQNRRELDIQITARLWIRSTLQGDPLDNLLVTIDAFDRAGVMPSDPRRHALEVYAARRYEGLEARAASGGPATYAIDRMTVGPDGRITRLAIYYRR